VLPVKLQPNRLYAVWLNFEAARNFQDNEGKPALPYLLIFQTKK
jgi:RNA polymerase sigma-70 factor (ECF subfamily)